MFLKFSFIKYRFVVDKNVRKYNGLRPQLLRFDWYRYWENFMTVRQILAIFQEKCGLRDDPWTDKSLRHSNIIMTQQLIVCNGGERQ